MDKQDVRNLKKRYLLWLYKTTKDAFDTYERKFTQLEIDEFILESMENILKGSYLPREKKPLEQFVNDFRDYIVEKEKATLELKYKGKKVNPQFIFLDLKLEAIEKAIVKELGKETLNEIKSLYEVEMIGRILKSSKQP
ncbi:MAG: hypothetical protein WDL87_03320 [Candidatus Omnitrophota bacterium]|jgi:uncharacterized protein YdiU (UPF0061 family)